MLNGVSTAAGHRRPLQRLWETVTLTSLSPAVLPATCRWRTWTSPCWWPSRPSASLRASASSTFTSQHYLGREALDVPAEFVEALLPGASALLQRLHSGNQRAQLRSEADHSEVYFVVAAIRLAHTFWTSCQLSRRCYQARNGRPSTGSSRCCSSMRLSMEKQRMQPWAQMVPGLASTLQHVDNSVRHHHVCSSAAHRPALAGARAAARCSSTWWQP
jgi:hypothetical protein